MGISDLLGKGQFSTVYRAIHIDRGDVVALKEIKIPFDTKQELERIGSLRLQRHPNIVKLIEVIPLKRYQNAACQTFVKLILQYFNEAMDNSFFSIDRWSW